MGEELSGKSHQALRFDVVSGEEAKAKATESVGLSDEAVGWA